MGNSCFKSEDSNTPVMNPTSEKPEIIRKTSTAAIVKEEPIAASSPKILSRPQTSSKTVSNIETAATSDSKAPSRPQTSSKNVSDIETAAAAAADSKTDSLGPSRPQTSSKNVSDIDNTAEIKPLSPSPSKTRVTSLSASLSAHSIPQPKKKLIVLAGDATDADGCIEFAMFAKEIVDILYLMHISHPFGVPKDQPTFESIHEKAVKTGLPFPEMCKIFNANAPNDERTTYKYSTDKSSEVLLKRCQSTFQGIFEECKRASGTSGNLFFRYSTEDGTKFFNQLNPFGFVWGSELNTFNDDFDPTPELTASSPLPNLEDYSEVIFDISGSTAFWEIDSETQKFVREANNSGLLKYVVVMGSVLTTEEPKTLAVQGAMVRHPMATMNQIYAFETQPAFVEFIVQNVLKSKKEDCPMLVKVLDHFYKVESKFKWKLFDCLTGKIICNYLKSGQLDTTSSGPSPSTAMFTEAIHGVTVVGPKEKDQVIVENVYIPSFTTSWYESN
eukprot:gene27189-35919_t